MTYEKKAQVILEAIDKLAPTTVNWNFKKQWITAIKAGIKEVEKSENKRRNQCGNQEG